MTSEPPVSMEKGDPGEDLARRDELAERLVWLIRLRWIALAGVLAAVVTASAYAVVATPWPLLAVAAVMTLLNLGFSGLHSSGGQRTLRALGAEGLLQIAVDVVGLGLLLFFAGGLSNPFVFYFTFHVVIAAILLEPRQAYGVALLTTAVVACLGLAEHVPAFKPRPLQGPLVAQPVSGFEHLGLVFVLGTTQIFSVYFVTSIMQHLRGRNRDVKRLNADLAERVDMLAAAERKLKAEHARARAILECMDEGVVVVDLTGKVLLANTAGLQNVVVALEDTYRRAGVLLGNESETKSEIRNPKHEIQNSKDGITNSEPHCDHHELDECLTHALHGGGTLNPAALQLIGADPPRPARQSRLKAPDAPAYVLVERHGRQFENTLSAVRTEPGGTLGLVVVSREITERRSLESQVLHAEKLHAVGSLAAGVAHELNTPLGTILGYAQMLLEDPAGPNAAKDLKSIEEQAQRCRNIVKGLLEFARKSGGERQAVAPGVLLAKAAELTQHTLEMRGIALAVGSFEPAALPQVSVTVQEIEQVLVNLITNAADAIEEGLRARTLSAGAGRVALEIQADVSGGVVLAVADNGPGVPDALRRQIFEPFFTTKAAGKGTGLGLSIARRIVEDHGGTLDLAPTPEGRGTRFEIRLPSVGQAATKRKNLANAKA